MKNYQHWIGDYQKATRRLTLLEHGAYRLLMDEYYATEAPLPLEHHSIYRVCGAFTPEEQAAVEKVLKQFFKKTAEGHHHKRCQEEIDRYRKFVDSRTKAANTRWSKDAHAHAHADASAYPHADAHAYNDAMLEDMHNGYENGCINDANHNHNQNHIPKPKSKPKTTTTALPKNDAEEPAPTTSDSGDKDFEDPVGEKEGKVEVRKPADVIPIKQEPDKMSLKEFIDDWCRTIHCLTPGKAVIEELTELYHQSTNRALKQSLITLGAKNPPNHNYGTSVLRGFITAQTAAANMSALRKPETQEGPF